MRYGFARTSVVLLLLAGMFAFGLAGGKDWFAQAQEAPPRPSFRSPKAPTTGGELPRTITVVGEGRVKLEPNIARATIGVEVTDASVKAASRKAAQTMEAVIAALKKQGVAEKDIQTSSYNIYSINMDRTPPGPQGGAVGETAYQTAYRVRNAVSVTMRDLDAVGEMLDAAIEAGANNIYGVNFGFANPERAMAEARRRAAADARARAEELAALHGVTVGEVVSISEVVGGSYAPPVPPGLMSFGGGGGPIMPGELEVSARLQVVYAIAPEVVAARPPVLSPEEYAQTATPAPPPAAITVPVQRAVLPTPTPVSEAASARPVSTPPAPLTIVGGDEEGLREFVKRWLTPRYPGVQPGKTTLFIGALPEDLPFELPLPEGARVIGSVVREDRQTGIQIILDAQQPAEAVTDFYVQALKAQGFAPPELRQIPGDVFISGGPQTTLCRSDDDLAVFISAVDVEGDPTDVRISVQSIEGYGPCRAPYPGAAGGAQSLLPRLKQPVGAVRTGSAGGGGSNDSYYATADLETELSVTELADHYYPQLKAAGWELVNESRTDAVAWSTWTLTDEKGDEWIGTLLIVDRPAAPDGRFAMLRVERPER